MEILAGKLGTHEMHRKDPRLFAEIKELHYFDALRKWAAVYPEDISEKLRFQLANSDPSKPHS